MALELNDNISKEAQSDILELETRINKFKDGKIDEDRFKAFRLARGVYGQRQEGVQMLRLKLPYGKLTGTQLVEIAKLAEEYTNGNLHATTRQNIQLHYVKLEESPEIWARLEAKGVTTKEACGNTVRNNTASARAGIDPNEPFDVTPYVEEAFRYFLRNPICQEMGRKIKMAFSSSSKDTAFTYIHDFGFIPILKTIDGIEQRGFKVVVGGGLGAQAFIAETAKEFLHEDELLPFIEAGIRVFDRFGEREKRHKARLKFLIEPKKGLGLEKFLELIEAEQKTLPNKTYKVDRNIVPDEAIPEPTKTPQATIEDQEEYDLWLKTNVKEQKQKDFYSVNVRLPQGNISSETTKDFVKLIDGLVADDIRITVSQGFLLRYARKENLDYLYQELKKLGLADSGAETIADITACPGTDTCNLGVTNSTGITQVLEDLLKKEYKSLITDANINIKISGCMNSCGQHMIGNIGFHGSSIKNGALVVPALQVVIGGGVDVDGKGFIADKVIKLPTKRIPDAVRVLLDEYIEKGEENEYFNDFYQRFGKMHFYSLLKPLADLTTLTTEEYQDWGQQADFIPEIGVGECAGVSLDVVGTIITDSEERLYNGQESLKKNRYADSIYHSYSSVVIAAKALLLSKDVHCNTHDKIIADFDQHYVAESDFELNGTFRELIETMRANEPTAEFATSFAADADSFFKKVLNKRSEQLLASGQIDKSVVNFYRA